MSKMKPEPSRNEHTRGRKGRVKHQVVINATEKNKADEGDRESQVSYLERAVQESL